MIFYKKFTLNLLRYENVDWFVDGVKKLETKMHFFSTNTKKDKFMTKEDEEGNKNISIRRFCEKEKFYSEVRDLCQLTGKYRSPADQNLIRRINRNKAITFDLSLINSKVLIVNYSSKS